MSTFHGNARPHLLAGLESAQADHGADVSPARVRRPPVLTVGREAVTRLPGGDFLLDLQDVLNLSLDDDTGEV